jgi:hypothetical protein
MDVWGRGIGLPVHFYSVLPLFCRRPQKGTHGGTSSSGPILVGFDERRRLAGVKNFMSIKGKQNSDVGIKGTKGCGFYMTSSVISMGIEAKFVKNKQCDPIFRLNDLCLKFSQFFYVNSFGMPGMNV